MLRYRNYIRGILFLFLRKEGREKHLLFLCHYFRFEQRRLSRYAPYRSVSFEYNTMHRSFFCPVHRIGNLFNRKYDLDQCHPVCSATCRRDFIIETLIGRSPCHSPCQNKANNPQYFSLHIFIPLFPDRLNPNLLLYSRIVQIYKFYSKLFDLIYI